MPDTAPPWLAGALVRAMQESGYPVDSKPGEVTIVYVEGMSTDGTKNSDAPDGWNDLRCTIQDGRLSVWQSTTEPGRHYTESPLHAKGAARIELGHHSGVWQVGKHRGLYEALVQTGAAIPVRRDKNKDYQRDNDAVDTGYFGINQHHGNDASTTSIGGNSAGCIVGRTVAGHREFMLIVKSDPRYKANKQFKFSTTVLLASQVLKWVEVPPKPFEKPSTVPHAAEYLDQWRRMTIQAGHTNELNTIARKLLANKKRYEAVGAKLGGIPWYFIAALHQRESSGSFTKNLHNGQPLGQVTTIEPKGRGPFSTWEESAIDALKLKGLEKIKDWSIERQAYQAEGYNGFGYRNYHPTVKSPYLWSFSNHYTVGKYIADGKWSSTQVDEQVGVMPLIRELLKQDSFIEQPVIQPPPVEVSEPAMLPAALTWWQRLAQRLGMG